MRRGELWWASLPDPLGSAPGFRRPVVVVQTNQFNESRINTVIVAAITSNLRLAAAPGNLFLDRTESGLPRNSVLNVSQLLTIDKSLLDQPIGVLPEPLIGSLNAGLRLVLGL